MKKVAINLFVYGGTHALVDASCVMLLIGGIDVRGDLFTYIILYNILAFGLQLPFGWIADRIHQPILSAVLGCVLLSFGLVLFIHPLISIILAGIGNALFHVGGGSIALNLNRGKAALPGIFVAPGAIGLISGDILLKTFGFHPTILIVLLLVCGLFIFLIKSPVLFYERANPKPFNLLILTIILLLITICIRSLVGLSVVFPWKYNTTLLIALTISIALGKGLGGFIADYFGWIRITVSSLLLSSLLLFIGSQIPVIAIIGMFLFNLTMPVSLVAISNLLSGRPGFSFGLSTTAILLGALPTFFKVKTYLSADLVLLCMMILSAGTLYFALKKYNINIKTL